MTDQSGDVFKTKEETQTPATNASPSDALADRLRAIVNERGEQKYDSVEKALEGLANAQGYIPQLKTELQKKEEELARLKAELEARGSVESVIDRLTAQKGQDVPSNQGTPPDVKGLDEKAAMELFEKMLNEKQSKTQLESNRRKVNDALVQKYGDKAAEVIAEKAKALGTSPEKIGALAGESPDMVLALFGTESKTRAPTTTSVNMPGRYAPQEPTLEKPSKSLLSGASTKEQMEYMRKVREEIYRKHGITP